MAEMNKRANSIINRVALSGEPATVFKHGEPIAEIRPLEANVARKRALSDLSQLSPVQVNKRVDEVIRAGRQRGV